MEKNGVSLVKGTTEDLKVINTYVVNSEPIPVKIIKENEFTQETGQKKKNISLSVTPQDLLNMSSLDEIVPSGFIIVHKDLEEILKALKSSSGASGFLNSTLSVAAGNFLGGAALGLAGTLFNGVDSETTDHMQGIITELNKGLTVDDFEGDPEVEQAQKDAFIQYLKVYYFQQTSALAGASVGGAVAEAVNAFLDETIGKLFRKITGSEESSTPDKLAVIAQDLDKDLTVDFIREDSEAMEEVKKIQRSNAIAYLKAFYAAQISKMAGETAGNFIGGTASGFINSLISGIMGPFIDLFTKGEGINNQAVTLESIARELTNSIDVNELSKDEDILNAQKDAVMAYLNLYYNAQVDRIKESTSKTLLESVWDYLENSIGGVFSRIFGFGDRSKEFLDDNFVNKLQQLIKETNDNLSVSDLLNNEVITSSRNDAIAEYAKIYYDAQIETLKAESKTSILEKWGESVGKTINKFINGLFGKDDEEVNKSENTFVLAITNALEMVPSDFSSIDGLDKVKRDSIFDAAKYIIESSTNTIKDKFKSKIDKDAINDALGGFESNYLAALGRSLSMADISVRGSTMSTGYSEHERTMRALNAIASNTQRILQVTENISEKTSGNIIINNQSEVEEDLELLEG